MCRAHQLVFRGKDRFGKLGQMPELPEVEFCRQRLSEWLSGQIIESVWAEPASPPETSVQRRFSGLSLARLGDTASRKALFLDFGGSDLLWVHLGMTGKGCWTLQSLDAGFE